MRLTRAQRRLLELAVMSETGNPWPLIVMRQRTGGAMSRMFDGMKADGLFDDSHVITPKGYRASLSERVEFAGRRWARFLPLDEPVMDGSIRCVFCGQIDEPEVHVSAACPAACNLPK